MDDVEVDDATEDVPVVTGLVDPLDGALDPTDHVVDDRRARAPALPSDRRELVGTAAGEDAADVLLMFAEDVDAEDSGLLDLWPTPGRLAREERDEGRVERHRRERSDGESGRRAVVDRGDHDDPGREVSEHLTELGLVERRDVVLRLPVRHSAGG